VEQCWILLTPGFSMITNFMHFLSGFLANFQLDGMSRHNGEASHVAWIGRWSVNHNYIFRRPVPMPEDGLDNRRYCLKM